MFSWTLPRTCCLWRRCFARRYACLRKVLHGWCGCQRQPGVTLSRPSSNLTAVIEQSVGASYSQINTTDDVACLCILWSGANGCAFTFRRSGPDRLQYLHFPDEANGAVGRWVDMGIATSASFVYTCSQGRLHHVFVSSGWLVQLDMQTSVPVPRFWRPAHEDTAPAGTPGAHRSMSVRQDMVSSAVFDFDRFRQCPCFHVDFFYSGQLLNLKSS